MSIANLINPAEIKTMNLSARLDLISKCSAVLMAAAIPVSTTGTSLFAILTIIFSLLSGQYKEKIKLITQSAFTLIAILFFVWMLISLSYTAAAAPQAITIIKKYSKLLYIPILLPLFVEKRWRDAAIHGFLVTAILTLVLSYLKYYAGWRIGLPAWPAAVFNSYIESSFVFCMGALFCGHKIIFAEKHRWVYAILTLFFLYDALFMSMSRTGYVIVIALIGLAAVQYFGWKGMLCGIIIVPLLFVGAYFASPVFKERLSLLTTNIESYSGNVSATSAGLRLSFWSNGLDIIKKHPIIGSGAGSIQDAYAVQASNMLMPVHNAHNEYINIAIQFGIIGEALLLLLFLAQFLGSFKLPREAKFYAQAILATIMLGSLVNSWVMDSTEGHFFIFFSAVFLAAKFDRVKKKESESLPAE